MKKYMWIAVAAMAFLPMAAAADQHEMPKDPPPLTDVWMVVPKAGMQAKFDAAAKKHMAFRAQAGESRVWMALRPVIGDNLNVVMYRSCCFNYADMDAYIVEDEKLGLGDDWNKNVDPFVDRYHHYLSETDWENSHWPEGSDGPYFGATSWIWKEGAGPGADEIRKKLSQMAKNDGWAEAGHNWLWLNGIGGQPTIAVVSSFESFADMAPEGQNFFEFIAQTMGSAEKAGEMFTNFGSAFVRSDYTVWVYDADHSTPSSE